MQIVSTVGNLHLQIDSLVDFIDECQNPFSGKKKIRKIFQDIISVENCTNGAKPESISIFCVCFFFFLFCLVLQECTDL